MDLRAAVGKYLEVVHEFGQPMALSDFGLPAAELVAMIAAWEEDYHLHRHFELLPSSQASASQPTYSINGTTCGAILFRDTIRDVLGR
jgi:hypothetical protein